MKRKIVPLGLLFSAPFILTADWLQFRGPHSSGVTTETLPTNVTKDAIGWTKDLPGRGLSSPIVIDKRLFLTAADGVDERRLYVICLNTENGALIWQRRFNATGRTMAHPKTCVAAPSPASDGKLIYALYSSNDLIALDLDGNLKWIRGITWDYPNASNSLGLASSPVVAGNVLVVQVENDSDSFALGVDTQSGTNLWKVKRSKAANWTSPVVLSESEVALQSGEGVTVLHPVTGEKKWEYKGGAATIPTLTTADGILYVPAKGVTAVRQSANGPKVLWSSNQLAPSTASPIVLGQHIYTVSRNGVVSCGSIKDGQRVWQLRLTGPFSASPVAAGKHLYYVNEKGLLQVVDTAGDKGILASSLDLGDPVLGTPAVSDGALYLRSDRTVWKIAGR